MQAMQGSTARGFDQNTNTKSFAKRSTPASSRASAFASHNVQYSINPRVKSFQNARVVKKLSPSHVCRSQPDNSSQSKTSEQDVGLGLKSVWVGAEVLGNVIGAANKAQQKNTSDSSTQSAGPSTSGRLTRAEAIEAIKRDYDVNYFISGQGDLSVYAPDCRFADPFAGFNGTERFKRNVSNLGGMLRDVQLEITNWEELPDGNLKTKWRFNAILDLPWKPRLAAAGGTLHVFDPKTNLVVEHIESWDVEPANVVKSLIKPSAKIPTNNWDVLMNSVYDGDLKGIWFASSGNVCKFSAALLGLSVVSKAITGEGLGIWPLALVVLVVGLVTEALKISGGMQGGETGTGGRF